MGYRYHQMHREIGHMAGYLPGKGQVDSSWKGQVG